MSDPRIVLDNSVLSAFEAANWFHGPKVWTGEFDIVTTQRIWDDEFLPHHKKKTSPSWLSIIEVNLEDVEVDVPGKISLHDWSGVIAAELIEGSVLTTNDRAMKNTAEYRNISTLWGTAFAIQTYKKCGISVDAFDQGVPDYIDDVTINGEVANELRNSEKP